MKTFRGQEWQELNRTADADKKQKHKQLSAFVTNIIADKYTDRSLSWRGNEVRTDHLSVATNHI